MNESACFSGSHFVTICIFPPLTIPYNPTCKKEKGSSICDNTAPCAHLELGNFPGHSRNQVTFLSNIQCTDRNIPSGLYRAWLLHICMSPAPADYVPGTRQDSRTAKTTTSTTPHYEMTEVFPVSTNLPKIRLAIRGSPEEFR
jgi:hypothetical protein